MGDRALRQARRLLGYLQRPVASAESVTKQQLVDVENIYYIQYKQKYMIKSMTYNPFTSDFNRIMHYCAVILCVPLKPQINSPNFWNVILS